MNEYLDKIVAKNLVKNYELKEKQGFFRPKKRRTVHAVKDISVEIPKGKITGLLGINGAGKTTTIRMLSSIIVPTSGTLTMDGVDAVANHLWVKERRRAESVLAADRGGESAVFWQSLWCQRECA